MNFLDRVKHSRWYRPAQNLLGHRRRRVWAANGRAHLELRRLEPHELDTISPHLKEALLALEGVSRVELDAAERRVVVAYDRAVTDLEALMHRVEQVETRHGYGPRPFTWDRPEHPADLEPLVRSTVELGVDLVGIGIGTALRLAEYEPREAQSDIAGLVTLLENVPRFRRQLVAWLGPTAAELTLALTNAIVQAVAAGPVPPLVDLAVRGVQLGEGIPRHRAWCRREPELWCDGGDDVSHPAPRPGERPHPVPHGPIERYSENAWQTSLGAFVVGLAHTRSLKSSMAMLLDAVPKPARLGREAYAAQLGRLLAARDVVIFDPKVLRRLDRVDTVVIDGRLLFNGTVLIEQIIPTGGGESKEIEQHLGELFDPERPLAVHEGGGWTLGPLSALEERLDRRVRKRGRELGGDRAPVLILLHEGVVAGLVQTRAALDPAAEDLLAIAQQAGLRRILATDTPAEVEHLPAEQIVNNGTRLTESVRGLQLEGRVVCLIATGPSDALMAADCGIAVHRPPSPPARGADLLCRGGLDEAALVLEASAAARRVSHQSVTIAFVGAGVGGVVAAREQGLENVSPHRVMLAVNIAAILSMLNGGRVAHSIGRRHVPVRAAYVPWHALETGRVLERLGTREDGLSTAEAAARLPRDRRPRRNALALARAFVEELNTPLAPVLAAGAGLSAVVGSIGDAAMAGAAVGLNAAVGGVERYRTEREIASLEQTETPPARVRRDGAETVVRADQLVQGDVVLLKAGEVVPADCRVLASMSLEADESNLTGESLPVPKSSAPSFSAAVAERRSMLYEGTSIVAGQATAVVVDVGRETEARRGLAARGEPPPSGVEVRLQALTDLTVPLAEISGGILAAAGLIRHQELREVAGVGVSLAVAAVPEGLPLLATVAQLAAARRLSLRGALVRNPRAMEALGRVDVVCADKTGTLTEGHIRLFSVSDGRTDLPVDQLTTAHRRVLVAAVRASPEARAGQVLPHPTDRALLEGAAALGVRPKEGLERWERRQEMAFEPSRGYHAVRARTAEGALLSVKGAPEVLLPMCTTWVGDGGVSPLDASKQRELHEQAEQLASEGLRVLAVAERSVPAKQPLDERQLRELTFLGFVALSDPVRPTAAVAVRRLRKAGVSIMMITGDHPRTAERIAQEIGVANGAPVLTGVEIDRLDDDALARAIKGVTVVARATPSHKVRIVRALQRDGHVVAMAGDGGNDAPAIRLSNVGIALGRHSTGAARGAADLVVPDERIETIVDALVEGRGMWVSVRDAVAILTGGNLGEIGFTVGTGLFSDRPPLNARQLLLVNLLTDVAPAMAIALRPPPDVTPEALLREGPEASLGEVLNRDIAWRALLTGAGAGGAWAFARACLPREQVPTVALLALVGSQLGQTLVTARPGPVVLLSSLGSAALLLTLVQLPGVSQLFGCQPVGPVGLVTAATATTAVSGLALVSPRVASMIDAWAAKRTAGEGGAREARNGDPPGNGEGIAVPTS